MDPAALLPAAAGTLLCPLLPGVINRVKARAAGREGPPLLQAYFDLAKLARKRPIYSTSASWVVRAGPVVALSAGFVALLLLPLGPIASPLAFPGDLLLLAGLLALQRFALMAGALDVGSSFEGMGASREAFFASLAEPAFVLCLVVAAGSAGGLSLTAVLGGGGTLDPSVSTARLFLVAVALFLVMLAETARIPVDDPNTHLELTMIHEAMVLDHGGVDLAYITYASHLKLWTFAAIIVMLLVPLGGLDPAGALAVMVASVVGLVAVVGLVESTTARVRLDRVPNLLVGAGGLAAVAFLLLVF
jgi:formate hydrogenlyase subunit 4